MKVQQLLSEATVYFDGSQSTAGAPMYGGAEELGRHFDFNEVGQNLKPDGVPIWIARQGKQGEHRLFHAYGNDIELSVTLDLTKSKRESGSARAVLEYLWSHLWKKSEDGATPNLDMLGTVHDGTLAIVELDKSFEELFPPARLLREGATEHLGAAVVASSLAYRFSIDINVTVGQRTVPRKVTFEPRTTARSNHRIFYTQSPLPFEKHLAMIRSLLPEASTQ